MNEIDPVGNGDNVLRRHPDELRVAARMTAIAEHFVAAHSLSRPDRHAAQRPQLIPGCSITRCPTGTSGTAVSTMSPATSLPETCGIGIVHVLEAAALPQIEMIQRARAHAHHHVAGRRAAGPPRPRSGAPPVHRARGSGQPSSGPIEMNYQNVSGERTTGSPSFEVAKAGANRVEIADDERRQMLGVECTSSARGRLRSA